MNDSKENKSTVSGESSGSCCGDYTLAFLILRFWLAIRALVTGFEKFGAYKTIQMPLLDENGQPDTGGAMTEMKVKFYSMANYHGIPASLKSKFDSEVLLPKFALTMFDHLLGPLLIATGLMLLIGLGTRVSLFLQGLIYVALTVGLILIGQDNGVAWLGTHVALIAFALILAKYNRFALFKKC